MTILVTDLTRGECTFKLGSTGSTLLIYHNGTYRAMGKTSEDIRFSDGIYRYDPASGELVNKSGGTAQPAPADESKAWNAALDAAAAELAKLRK